MEIAAADWDKEEARAPDKDTFMCFDAFHTLMFEVNFVKFYSLQQTNVL
jgi:hypothetical protein